MEAAFHVNPARPLTDSAPAPPSSRTTAERIVVAGVPKLRAAHTVFTFADRELATIHPAIVDGIHPFIIHLSDKTPGLGLTLCCRAVPSKGGPVSCLATYSRTAEDLLYL